MNETLLTRARFYHKLAKGITTIMDSDELYLNSIGYNLQQSVEFAIKYILECNGSEYPNTHILSHLYKIAKSNNIDLLLTDYIKDHLEMLTSWELSTRYILDFTLEKERVFEAIPEVHKYLLAVEKKYDIVSYAINSL